MPPRIAIPMPHSGDHDYAERSIPQYERAIELAGGEPVRIALDQTPSEIMKIIERCDAVLLPGSKADVDPAKYDAPREPHTAAADARRDTVDELLLQDAYNMRKPILGICYGLQILNVYRSGSLVQHIPDFLPAEKQNAVNHEAGSKVPIAHTIEIEPGSKLAEVIATSPAPAAEDQATHRTGHVDTGKNWEDEGSGISDHGENQEEEGFSIADPGRNREGHASGIADPGENREGHGFSRADTVPQGNRALAPGGLRLIVPVNSSHHQSAAIIGDGLRIAARCPADGVIEALEGTSPDHFVLAVQWHPERSVADDEPSRAIFRALIKAAARHKQLTGEFESV
jgi:gamma-glutamyl-gamma-aminobutyrate hydrolase PuuD